MKRIIKFGVVVLIGVVFIGTLVFLYQKSREVPVIFEIGEPFVTDIIKKTVVTGTVIPRKEIEIKPQIIGIIDEIYVNAGDLVEKDDLIAKIRVTPNMVTLNNAETRLNQAKIALEDARITYEREKKFYQNSFNDGHLVLQNSNPAMIKLNTSLFSLENAKLDLEDAESEFANQKKLLAKGFTSSDEYQNAKLSLKKAQSDYKEAIENHHLVREETLETVEQEFQKAKLSFNKAQEEFVAAKNNLNLIKDGVSEDKAERANTLIRSTTDGMILDVAVKEGSLVIESSTSNVGTTVATIADMNDMIFEGSIDESEVGKIKEGMELILSIGAIEKETFKATIEYISPRGKKVSGAVQFDIRAKLILKESIFVRAGYSANADIVLEKRPKVLAIEERWLQFDKDKPFVEVESDSRQFEKKPIKVGISDGLKIEVLSGIAQKDRIKIPN